MNYTLYLHQKHVFVVDEIVFDNAIWRILGNKLVPIYCFKMVEIYVICEKIQMAHSTGLYVEFGENADIKIKVSWHVETVVLLYKGEVDSKKIRVEFSLEDMDMSEFQDGATYTQIKDYVLEHSGLKVSNLYISQIKRKCGIEVGKNYNLPKSEDSRQPQCPPEKEKAIREAMKYFGMI